MFSIKNSLDEEDPSSKMFLTGTIDGGFQEDPGAQNEQMVRCAWVSSVDVNFGYPIPNADLGFGELDEMVYFEDWIKNPEYVGSASKALQNALLKVFPNSKETPFDEYWGLRKKLYFLYQAALDAADDKKILRIRHRSKWFKCYPKTSRCIKFRLQKSSNKRTY